MNTISANAENTVCFGKFLVWMLFLGNLEIFGFKAVFQALLGSPPIVHWPSISFGRGCPRNQLSADTDSTQCSARFSSACRQQSKETWQNIGERA